jgi:hypothetical protein
MNAIARPLMNKGELKMFGGLQVRDRALLSGLFDSFWPGSKLLIYPYLDVSARQLIYPASRPASLDNCGPGGGVTWDLWTLKGSPMVPD